MHLRVTILLGEEEYRSASLQGQSLRKINMPFEPIIYPIWCSAEALWQEAADSLNSHTHTSQKQHVCVRSVGREVTGTPTPERLAETVTQEGRTQQQQKTRPSAPLTADACWDTAGNTISCGHLVRHDCRLIALSHRRRTSVQRSSSGATGSSSTDHQPARCMLGKFVSDIEATVVSGVRKCRT